MRPNPTWRLVVAFVLDLIFSFLVFGYLVAAVTGDLADGGFQLEGAPALLVFALVIAYFVVANRLLGGTLFRRVLRVPPQRAARPA